ncbi:MAG: hypothetical protein ABIO41_03890 [Ignavibacteria bacterium]
MPAGEIREFDFYWLLMVADIKRCELELYQTRENFVSYAGKDYYAVFFEDPDRIKVEVAAPHL